MKPGISAALSAVASLVALLPIAPALAQQKRPNIVVIMGDDVGVYNIGVYNQGKMSGKTPNLDRLAKEGMLFTDYYAEASCTAGRANFITGQLPLRTGLTTVLPVPSATRTAPAPLALPVRPETPGSRG